MDVQETSAKAARSFLDKAIKYGTFKNSYPVEYDTLGEILHMSPNECRICCEYLESIGCDLIVVEEGDYVSLELKVNPSVVDFLKNYPD